MKAAAGILTARGGNDLRRARDARSYRSRLSDRAGRVSRRLATGERLRILSFDSKAIAPVWRDIIAAGHKPAARDHGRGLADGRAEHNMVRLTDDHKTYFLANRKLVKKPIRELLAAEELVLAVDHRAVARRDRHAHPRSRMSPAR